MRIGCSGSVSDHSGIGILQKHLYPFLADAGHELVFSEPRDAGASPLAKVRGLVRGWRPASGQVDVYLSAVPPLPFGVRAPLLTLVYDLRWQRTRSGLAARYRSWDLHRAVAHSDALLCISDNTRQELVRFDAGAARTATAHWLGPGLVPAGSFRESTSGIVMLVGGAVHKRNELAAQALALATPQWVRGVVGVGVSPQVRSVLSPAFPCEWFDGISDAEMLMLYQRAQVFMMLGTDEGFGLPFTEALAAGCQIVATDHPLGREVAGPAAVLVPPGDAADVAEHLRTTPCVPADVRRKQAARFSWRGFGLACERQLVRIAGRCSP